MKPLGLLLVICCLASTGFCISCKSCWHMLGSQCNGSSVPCSSDQVCVASYTLISTVTSETPQYTLSCGSRSQCNANGSLTFNYGKLRTRTSCCDTNDCIPPFPTLPPVSSQKNKLTCRACFSDTSDYCYTGDTIECTGDEMKCGRMARRLSGTVTKNDALRGCATKSYCEIFGSQTSTIQGLNVDSKMFCSDGAPALHVGLLGSIVAILLTKLLF
ncbi:phospholipase A2 inhibitor 25 kDa subunit-like [Rana temporaria]|uniref:phospholipase A2 inhibitor 25 kDa subunit-like n=1 Tax=Rana temporaria TaxID=8407 RepID=UPI001AAC4E08|nr:phospholipase A2 inhibitor 25 kDa subunit-like [Rana temporaria]